MNLMKITVVLIYFVLGLSGLAAQQAARQLPDPLKSWQDWATWDDTDRNAPTPYFDAEKHLAFWPSRLELALTGKSGRFEMGVTLYDESWVPLPGAGEAWPFDVRAGETAVPVVEHDGKPSVHLKAGAYRLSGSYRWEEMPQRLAIPAQIGMLSLSLDGKSVEQPTWDAQGFVWLGRPRSEEADKDFLSVKVYRVIDDGIPMWLRTVVELSVSGKSREEKLGAILPEGWELAMVNGPIPVSIDDKGLMKAQVRAGKWSIQLNAFRLDSAATFAYPPGVHPAVEEELIAFHSKPDFRMVEVRGVPSIDVTQTTFPDDWRDLPVYRWETKDSFQLDERMRGMGLQKPEGLRVSRELWLDDGGRNFTFRDTITGSMQQIWRLDAAERQNLGSVRSDGQGQLITRNPANGAPGVELRSRKLNLEATGRMPRAAEISATGWRTDADSLNVTVHLPPGWRLFALFGADYVHGDWLTAWTLLDLFLLLVFSLAVYKLWGVRVGVLAFFAFALAYHEPGAPRCLWVFLLLPLALLRVAPEGWLRRMVTAWKWVAIALLALNLVPFLGWQIQGALYPQLERLYDGYGSLLGVVGEKQTQVFSTDNSRLDAAQEMEKESQTANNEQVTDVAAPSLRVASGEDGQVQASRSFYTGSLSARRSKAQYIQKLNLQYDTKARIQTGPGVPDWKWRSFRFGWNGPVQASQKFHPILIPMTLNRLLAVLRVALLVALAAALLEARRWKLPLARTACVGALLGLFFFGAASIPARAQIPDEKLLQTLRERLLETSDAFPNAADIPVVEMTLDGQKLAMDAEIHTMATVAVPLPGRLPAWSPLAVMVDGKPGAALRREDGYLWVALPAGVHRVRVEGRLANVTEWEWAFRLKPHRVAITAPGWTWNGVKPDGVPEAQVFFTRKQKSSATEAGYDRQDLASVVQLERNIELGLVWQVHNTVTRLSPSGRAISLRIPLLPGEKVLSASESVKDGCIEVRLGAQENNFSWESELTVADSLQLATRANDTWVETWSLVASPVWNVSLSGLPPVFEPGQTDLVPSWHPWPGEKVELSISRPEAVNGATVTVQKVVYDTDVGRRLRTASLNLQLQCSLGEDFVIDLPAGASVTKLMLNDTDLPVRMDGSKLVVPLRPGEQNVRVEWKTEKEIGLLARVGAVGLPVESANLSASLDLPASRWILWTGGPLRGPAVRLWIFLACALLGAWVLSRLAFSPLRWSEWMLLAVGLTQVDTTAALFVIAWFFAMVCRGGDGFRKWSAIRANFFQCLLLFLTVVLFGTLLGMVSRGLLGTPEMFIEGNGSYAGRLSWYQARADLSLPQPFCLSVSIWWYRLLMLAWALWLALAVIRWLKWGWTQFSKDGWYRPLGLKPKSAAQPPPVPKPDF